MGSVTLDQTRRLERGDLMVLYTDGVTEAMNEGREQFGVERLCEVVRAHAQQPVDEIVQRVGERVGEWCRRQVDDVTVVVIRYDGPRPMAATTDGDAA